MAATTKALNAKANAEKTKAERAEDARWKVCNSCGMERRLRPTVDGDGAPPGTMVWAAHNRWDARQYAMVPCLGSLKPTVSVAAPDFISGKEASAL